MKTAVIGFPRIGELRELKFALEKYFKNEISVNELNKTAEALRQKHWTIQRNAGINYISSNDFSYYDSVLDTAVLLGIIPKRYKELNLSGLDTYFAMARGYQGASGDVKALDMKKWYNTNYHYIVPELEDDMVIKLSSDKLMEEYRQAKELGIGTKPVVTGPYTILKLCRYTGEKKPENYTTVIVNAYKELLSICEKNHIEWLQLDEPSLVCDMDETDIKLFHEIYDGLLPYKGECKVLLQTYFGDVRDIYKDLIKMSFDGIGLDFIEGKKTTELIKKYGFPKDRLLFAGLINGKNILKNHYDKTLKILASLKTEDINVVLSTSCSLLHVPYTLKNEDKLSEKYLSYFAFAYEKLTELNELGQLADKKDY